MSEQAPARPVRRHPAQKARQIALGASVAGAFALTAALALQHTDSASASTSDTTSQTATNSTSNSTTDSTVGSGWGNGSAAAGSPTFSDDHGSRGTSSHGS